MDFMTPEPTVTITPSGPVFSGLGKGQARAVVRALLQDSVLVLGGLLASSGGRDMREVLSECMQKRSLALSSPVLANADAGAEGLCAALRRTVFEPFLRSDVFCVVSDSQEALCNVACLLFCRERAFFAALGPGLEPEPGFFTALTKSGRDCADRLRGLAADGSGGPVFACL